MGSAEELRRLQAKLAESHTKVHASARKLRAVGQAGRSDAPAAGPPWLQSRAGSLISS